MLTRGWPLLYSRRNLLPGEQPRAFVRGEERGRRLGFFGCVLCWILEEVPSHDCLRQARATGQLTDRTLGKLVRLNVGFLICEMEIRVLTWKGLLTLGESVCPMAHTWPACGECTVTHLCRFRIFEFYFHQFRELQTSRHYFFENYPSLGDRLHGLGALKHFITSNI